MSVLHEILISNKAVLEADKHACEQQKSEIAGWVAACDSGYIKTICSAELEKVIMKIVEIDKNIIDINNELAKMSGDAPKTTIKPIINDPIELLVNRVISDALGQSPPNEHKRKADELIDTRLEKKSRNSVKYYNNFKYKPLYNIVFERETVGRLFDSTYRCPFRHHRPDRNKKYIIQSVISDIHYCLMKYIRDEFSYHCLDEMLERYDAIKIVIKNDSYKYVYSCEAYKTDCLVIINLYETFTKVAKESITYRNEIFSYFRMGEFDLNIEANPDSITLCVTRIA